MRALLAWPRIGTLLEAARLLGEGVSIRVVGEGVERPELEARARAMNLTNIAFHPSVPRVGVPSILAAADRRSGDPQEGPLYEESLPTKLLETMAAARPAIVGADGLAARIVRESGAGYVASAEDPADLARAIDECRQDPGRVQRGAAGRAFVAQHYERGAILDRLAEIIARVALTT